MKVRTIVVSLSLLLSWTNSVAGQFVEPDNDNEIGSSGNETTIRPSSTFFPTEPATLPPSVATGSPLPQIPSAPPTVQFSVAPTSLPSTNPSTSVPTSVPSMLPSLTPSEPEIFVSTVTGQVPLKLVTTPSLMVGSTERTFLTTTTTFLTNYLPSDDETVGSLEVLQVVILRQFRQQPPNADGDDAGRTRLRLLQDNTANTPLYVVLQVVARRTHITDSAEEDMFDFSAILENLFQTMEEEYIDALQQDTDYFQNLETIDIMAIEDDVSPQPTASPTQSTVSPVASPVLSPTDIANGLEDVDDGKDDDDDDDDGPFSVGVIAAIAAGGVVIVILVCVALCLRKDKDNEKGTTTTASNAHKKNSGATTTSATKSKPKSSSGDNSKKSGDKPSSTKGNAQTTIRQESSGSMPIQDQTSDIESLGYYSYAKNDSDSAIGSSIMQNASIAGMDTMSYAYSLEPGLENSYADGYSGESEHSRPVPMEIPHITLTQNRAQSDFSLYAPSSAPGSTNDFGMETTLGGNVYDSTDLNPAPSDLQLTESELAMLPSNLRGSDEETDTTPQKLKTKEVMAPPGKLGLVIDTTVNGPVVHLVNDGSALKDKLFPGDIIVAIDNIDTRAMSASAITALMVKTANQERKLTIVDNQ